ncbi:MAG: sugar phosphate isomerase/epimerase [Patescibacteria group bacterium]
MLAITSDSFAGYGLDRAFELAAKAGLDGIEVVIRHEDLDTYDADYLKTLSKRHGLPIIALSTPIDMTADKGNRVVDLAEKVGAPLVTLTPPDIFDFNYKKWIKNEAKDLRRKKKIKIALVNPPSRTVLGFVPVYAFNDLYELREVSDIVFDTSNAASKGEPLLETYSTLKPSINHIHLSNAKHDRQHLLLDNGDLPLESFLTRLARDKFSGKLILKLGPKALGVGNTDKLLSNIENCKKFIAKYFRA